MTSALAERRMDDPGGGAGILTRRQAREDRRRQKRIVIFCNGDIFFKGKKLSITPNRYVSYNDLLQDLTYRMPQYLYLPNGVRQLFSPTSGRRVGDIGELRDGGAYVCAGNETFKPVKYGEAELMPWGKGGQPGGYNDVSGSGSGGGGGQSANTAAAAAAAVAASQFAGYNAFPPSKFLKRQHLPPTAASTTSVSMSNRFAALRGPAGAAAESSIGAGAAVSRQPKVVTVVKEGPRPRQVVKILLNRRGVQSYQQLLADISDSFGAQGRRARLRCLWTIGGREVRDVGDLFRDEELFIGSTEEAIGLDRVSDLLEELYPGNSEVKSLLRHWERRLRRREKRGGGAVVTTAASAAAVAPHRVEERDSGYEESDLTATTPTQRQHQHQQQQQDSTTASSLRGDRLKQALEARRHSKPLPLIHEPQQQLHQAHADDLDETAETNRQRRLEEQRLADEAATAKKDKQRRLNKQRETPAAPAAAGPGKEQQQAKSQVILPPIQQSAKEPQAPTKKEKQRKEKKGHSNQAQDSAAAGQVQAPLPALPQIAPPAPAEASLKIPAQQQQHAQQQQQQQRRSVTPDDQQRILSTVREEEKETEKEEEQQQPVQKPPATPQPQPQQHSSPQHHPESNKVSSEEAPSSAGEKKPLRSSAKKAEAAKRKSASKQEQQPKTSAADQEPPGTSPRPLIRPISSSRFINERFELGKTMGDGNFAIVRACVKKESRNEYAMKVIDKSKLRGKEHMVINEVRIMKLCQHANIVRLLEEYETRTEIYLVMELVKGGDLFDAISQVVKFNEMQSAHMVADMANALFYLHSRNIVHRDLKPENLLVYRTKDNKISLKLGDFGLAMEVEKPIYTVCGTPTYVAPEILEERGYGLEVDLWAMGVITYILLCGFPPFRSRERRQTELFQFIKSGLFDFLSPYWDHISLSAKDLIQHLLVVERRRRYTAIDVLCHPWVISFGGSKKLSANVQMKEYQAKLREQLVKQAEEGMAEFQKVKAVSIYGSGNAK